MSDVVSYRLPSFEVFGNTLTPNYFFGAPRTVVFDGFTIDVDLIVTQVVSKSNDISSRLDFLQASGIRGSILEHVVPEQLFRSDEVNAVGMSAVKAIVQAANEGQKIWVVREDNINQALSNILLGDDISQDILNSVNSGKIVIAHEKAIAFTKGMTAGYVIFNPETGAGAYRIAGGINGGILDTLDKGLDFLINGVAMIEEEVGDAKYLSSALKQLTGSVKRTLQNIKRVIEIVKNCNVAGALAGILIFLLQAVVLYFTIKIAIKITTVTCAISSRLEKSCSFIAPILLLPQLIDFTNFLADDALDIIINNPICTIGTE